MAIMPHRIAVGSQNPTKVASVTHVVRRLWPGVEVIAVEVPSGVDVQPTSEEEANGLVTRVAAQEKTVAML